MRYKRQLPKRVLISFLGNINYDTRCINLIDSLKGLGYEVDTLSFDWLKRPRGGSVATIKLSKKYSSIFFYFKFAIAVLSKLIYYRYDKYIASDIYNLPFLSFFAKIYSKPLVYDSRELFKYLAGLKDKKGVQSLLAKIEKRYIKDCTKIIVTGLMDAEVLKDDYEIPQEKFVLLRNLPKLNNEIFPLDLRQKYKIPIDSKILIYQGVVLKGRGLTKIIEFLPKFSNLFFILLGDGDFRDELTLLATKLYVKKRVIFAGTIKQNELLSYTAGADIGCALIENISKSYYYALPNKLFEYIAAGIPVITSNLPQMEQIIDQYKVGICVNPDDEDAIITAVKKLMDEAHVLKYKENAKAAAIELNWEKEFLKVKDAFI